MRAILAFPCADACSATRPAGGIGAATYAYAKALQGMGFEIDIIGSKRAIVDDFNCLRVDRVRDIVPTLIALAPSYDLVVTVGLHSRLSVETAQQLVAESKALIYECEDEPTMALKQYRVIESSPNVRFISDRPITSMPKACPAVGITQYAVARNDALPTSKKIDGNRFIYAGRIASDKNIIGLATSKFDVDFHGDASGFPQYVGMINRHGGLCFGRYVPQGMYNMAVNKYLAFISFSYERGISYQLVEALRCGMPLILASSNPAWPSLLGVTDGTVCDGRHAYSSMGVVVDTNDIRDGDVDEIAEFCFNLNRINIRDTASKMWGEHALTTVFKELIVELGVVKDVQ